MPVIDGRRIMPVPGVPEPVVAELERRARAAGVDPADRWGEFARWLGDLVAAELPAALAEAAAALLAEGREAERRLRDRGVPSDTQRPGLNPGRAGDLPTDAAVIIPARGMEPGSGDDDRAA